MYRRHLKKDSGKHTQKKIFWVRKIYSERKQKGDFNMLVKDLQLYDELFLFKYFRMSRTVFEDLSKWVAPYIINCDERT